MWQTLRGKKIILMLAIAVLLPAFIFLIHFRWQQQVLINASVYEAGPQMTLLHNIRKWYPGADSSQAARPDQLYLQSGNHLILKTVHGAAMELLDDAGNAVQVWIAQPDDRGFQTTVTMSQRVSVAQWLYETVFKSRNDQPLYRLKLQLEDPARRYGFPFQLVPVSDTLILTSSFGVGPGQDSMAIAELHARLTAYLQKNKVPLPPYYLVSRQNRVADSVQVSVGLPLQKQLAAEEGMFWLRLPGNGRLLSGAGNATQLQALYTAMNQYCIDNSLKRVAQPLERHDTAGSKSITLLFPVY